MKRWRFILGRVLLWLYRDAQEVLATLSLAAISLGCWMERPSLGLIVPGALVFGCLAYTWLREGN